MKENIRVMSVDWLSLFGNFIAGEPAFLVVEQAGFIVEHQDRGTKQFRKWTKILDGKTGLMIAEVCYSPYSVRGVHEKGIYRPNAGTLRVDNRVCYSSKLFEVMRLVSGLIGFHCQSISRIDLCMDMHTFDNGLRPENLIRKFYTGEYLKHGYTKALGFGTQYNEYMPETLSFKGKNSAVSVKLYDKTKEMKDVKTKPWIEALWNDAGLDSNKRVWRLELAIKSDAKRLVAMETGEYIELGLEYLSNYENLQKLFYSLISVYFKWHVKTVGKKKCECPVLALLDSRKISSDLRRVYVSQVNGLAKKHRRIDRVLKEAYKCCRGNWNDLAVIDNMYSILFENYNNIWEPTETSVVLLRHPDNRHEFREVDSSCLQSIDENLLISIEQTS